MTFSENGNWPGDIGARMRAGIFEAGHMVGQELVKRVKNGMTNGSKSGRIYSHPKRGTYQASASPGEYSAVVSGDLINSIAYRMKVAGYLSFYATSGHAGYQEYGTRKMGPRENLKRAIDESDGVIKSIVHMIVMRSFG